MAYGHWVWVYTCGAQMRPGPGLQEDDLIYAHMDHHKEALALAAHEEGAVSALPRVMTTPPAALPPPVYEARWMNLATGEVDAGRTYVIENPEYEAFQRHGGTPYQIEPQHDGGPISPGDRIDRAIQDVDREMGLIEKADRVLVEPATADRCRDRLARAVNLLSSAARDVDILRTELPIIYADREAVARKQRTWVPFEPQPMFGWDPEEGRYVREAGNVQKHGRPDIPRVARQLLGDAAPSGSRRGHGAPADRGDRARAAGACTPRVHPLRRSPNRSHQPDLGGGPQYLA